jgi:CO dehydrogenase maturation factor
MKDMKKVSIAGKGGTGKSVLTALLARALEEEGYQVLILDSDESNPGLYRMLGFNQAPSDLINLLGGPRRVMEFNQGKDSLKEKGAPTGTLSRERIYLQDIPGKYLVGKNRLQLASVGKITSAFEGCACPMAEVLKIFLGRIALREKEVVLVDMEAGVEHFGRGVEKYIDTLLILVEPSFESIALASKINLLAQASGVKNTGAVMNKITSPAINQKMQEELNRRRVRVIGMIPFDEEISESCLEGKSLEGSKAKENVRRIAQFLLGESNLIP